MANFVHEGNRLVVSGYVAVADLDEFLERGRALLESDAPRVASGSPAGATPRGEVILDLVGAVPESSTFVGVVARLGIEARSGGRTLVARASGRAADWLVWAGLHKLISLSVSCGQPAGAA